jgi:hypothetical protein
MVPPVDRGAPPKIVDGRVGADLSVAAFVIFGSSNLHRQVR